MTFVATRRAFLSITVAIVLISSFAISVAAQQLIATVPVGRNPAGVGVNRVTNKIYVANGRDGTVTVIDGNTNSTTTVTLTGTPSRVAVNDVTNQIYVLTWNTLAVIDGATNNVTELNIQGAWAAWRLIR